MLSSGTGRITPPKIVIICECGKRYRVPVTKAGKRVRCKVCRLKIEVPGSPGAPAQDGAISFRTRKAILGEFGIDAEAAEKQYAEKKKIEGYLCAHCAEAISEDELKAAYCEEGLVCESCRVAAVQQREFGDPVENARKKRLANEKVEWARRKDEGRASKKAWALSALFFFGTAGFVHTFFAPAALITVGVAGAVAYFGGKAAYNADLTPDAPVEDDEDREE